MGKSSIVDNNQKISILVVDDDQICLNVIAQHLRTMNYHVVPTMNPIEAISKLEMNHESFDIVITDVHMPQMNGLELLKHVKENFQLPVVLMSTDYNKDIMLKGLEEGASFYIMKPISQKSLTKIWQFAISRTNILCPNYYCGSPLMHSVDDKGDLIISNNNNNNNNTLRRTNEDGNTKRKPRMIWTTSLHNLFLEAVNTIGIGNAAPKKILEHMNVPGLRRENVASHLQKYRIFLKRIYQSSIHSEPFNWNSDEKPITSSFVLNEITYLSNNFEQQCQELMSPRKKVKYNDQSSKDPQEEEEVHVENVANNNANSVGLQISPNNEELVCTINNNNNIMSTNNNHNYGIMSTRIIAQEEANYDAFHDINYLSQEVNHVISDNETSIREINHVNLYFDLGGLFDAPQEMVG